MPEDYRRPFEEPKRQVEQLLQDPSVFVKDLRIEPFTPLLRTNNFLQNCLSRLLAFSPTENRMVKVRADEEGRLEMFEGQPGSLENRLLYNGVIRDLANGATGVFDTAHRLTGNMNIPQTIPEGKQGFIKRGYVSGTSPAEIRLQVQVGGVWFDAKVAFIDSYDELDHLFWVTNPYPEGTILRIIVINHGSTADFCCSAEAYLEKLPVST